MIILPTAGGDAGPIIVKAQLSLFEPRSVLVYNRDRSIRSEFIADRSWIAMFPPGVFKIYYHARVEGDRLVMLSRADDQAW